MPQDKHRRRIARVHRDSFAAVIHQFLASPKFKSLAESTQEGYRHKLKLAERSDTLGSLPIFQIRPALVQAFLDGLAHTPATQQAARTALMALERWAIVRDLIPYPITTGTEVIGSNGGHKPWTDEQVKIAETHARPDLSRVITLAANTGQRGSDLVRMRWSDIETHEGCTGISVQTQKTGLNIWIPMTQDLEAAVGTWTKRPTFLLLKPDGQPWRREQLSDAWTKERDTNPELVALASAGLVLHGLRATAIVRLRRAGATTGQIKDMVGLSEAMVNRYCRFSSQRTNALAAVIHLDHKPRIAELTKKRPM